MLLVRTVSGPSEAVIGTRAVYRATSFNMSNPPPAELRRINWAVESGGQTVARFDAVGDTLEFDVPVSLAGRTIRVMPFRNAPTPVVSIVSRVVAAGSVVAAAGVSVTVLTRAEWGRAPTYRGSACSSTGAAGRTSSSTTR